MNSQVFGEVNNEIDIRKYFEHEDFVSGTGEIIETSKIVFEIGKDNNVHVKHVVEGQKWGPSDPKLLKVLPGKHSNLQVTDEDGDYLRPIGFVGETFEESEYVILGQKPFVGYDLVVEYDLENFMELNDNGIWAKHFVFTYDVMIYFDKEIELIFANSRPVDVSNAEGINCLGCDILIEFFDKSDPIIKKIIKNETRFEELSDSGKEFNLEFLTNAKINDLNYIQELNYFSFDINKGDIVDIRIPLDLLLSPYYVYLTGIDQDILLESDKILKSEYGLTETHSNVSFKAQKDGVIHLVGSTEMEHEEFRERIENRQMQSVTKTEEDVKPSMENELKDSSDEELYKSWEPNVVSNEDNTIIFVIIGIVAAIIIGIIVKLKKN